MKHAKHGHLDHRHAFLHGTLAGLTVIGTFVGGAISPPPRPIYPGVYWKPGIAGDVEQIGRDMYTVFQRVGAGEEGS